MRPGVVDTFFPEPWLGLGLGTHSCMPPWHPPHTPSTPPPLLYAPTPIWAALTTVKHASMYSHNVLETPPAPQITKVWPTTHPPQGPCTMQSALARSPHLNGTQGRAVHPSDGCGDAIHDSTFFISCLPSAPAAQPLGGNTLWTCNQVEPAHQLLQACITHPIHAADAVSECETPLAPLSSPCIVVASMHARCRLPTPPPPKSPFSQHGTRMHRVEHLSVVT